MNKQNDLVTKPEIIKMILRDQKSSPLWQPIIGEESLNLLERLNFSEDDRNIVKDESIAVLSQCISPHVSSGTQTGVIIGYIQSGKTTSFTTVAALAKDNDYRLIIIITGITSNLFKQSNDRLDKDLRLSQRSDRKWKSLNNPRARSDEKQKIATALQRDGKIPGITKQTVLITVMKNRTHLNNLITLLSGLSLNGVPTLIIDDEADQASLNNLVNKGKESATYKRIREIRELLPHHTFLQYTATPQAPLLINIIDVLSPNFAVLLTPGPAYTGGKTFFEKDFRLIRRISSDEIPSKDQILTEPPNSLLEAMRIFFLGVASGLKSGDEGKNRSMMVHPSKETMQHASYELWVRDIQYYWSQTLQLEDADPDRRELIEDFQKSYNDLYSTVENIQSFDELLEYLPYAINDTIVTTVNAAKGPTPQPDWRQDYAHIVVGGEVLNRGYTIEGLTVTYMPRSKGVGNADTIQQRARWFGYKAEYLGYCRVYLTDEQRRIYKDYVTHEENVRGQLRELAITGRSLKEWRRAFFLSPELRPTRHDVIDLEYIRGDYSTEWFQQHAPHDSSDAVKSNNTLIEKLVSMIAFQKESFGKTDIQTHLVASNLSLDFVYRDFLTKYLVTRPSDSHNFIGLLLQLKKYIEQEANNELRCTIYLMSEGKQRTRSVDEEDKIPNLLQGANPTKKGSSYVGDRGVFDAQNVTIQIHRLNLYQDKAMIADNIPAIAIALPKEMPANWIVQTDKKASKKFARPQWD